MLTFNRVEHMQTGSIIVELSPLRIGAPGLTLGIEDLNGEDLQGVAAELGIEAALRLFSSCAGRRVYIPKFYSPEIRFQGLSADEVERLCRAFGPTRMEIPKTPLSRFGEVRVFRARCHIGDENWADVAADIGVSYRTGQQIIAEIKRRDGVPVVKKSKVRLRSSTAVTA